MTTRGTRTRGGGGHDCLGRVSVCNDVALRVAGSAGNGAVHGGHTWCAGGGAFGGDSRVCGGRDDGVRVGGVLGGQRRDGGGDCGERRAECVRDDDADGSVWGRRGLATVGHACDAGRGDGVV